MSGHSKWSKVKHQKGAADIKRGQSFTKIANAITIAVKQGGGIIDPEANFHLRIAIDKARTVNMPKENIRRAVERGRGISIKNELEEVLYEGYGPGGVAILIQAATDNRQRTTATIKNILENHGGRLASPRAVSYNFKTKGIIIVKKGKFSSEEILHQAVIAGAEDIEENKDLFFIQTAVDKLNQIKEKLISTGLLISSFEMSMEPQILLPVTDQNLATKIIQTVKCLEELEDVQKVYTNFNIPDNIFKKENL